MKIVKLLLLVVAAIVVNSCALVEPDRTASCGGHRLQVADLGMAPDPITDGHRVSRWIVKLRADGRGDCRTTIRIYERPGNELIGRERASQLRPGINEIDIEPLERYRFRGSEHCYQVTVDIAGTYRPVDAARRFCARQVTGRRWTMK